MFEQKCQPNRIGPGSEIPASAGSYGDGGVAELRGVSVPSLPALSNPKRIGWHGIALCVLRSVSGRSGFSRNPSRIGFPNPVAEWSGQPDRNRSKPRMLRLPKPKRRARLTRSWNIGQPARRKYRPEVDCRPETLSYLRRCRLGKFLRIPLGTGQCSPPFP